VTVNSSGVTVTGTFAATSMSGSGASLTGLNASNLSTGTVPDARFPATLPAASGVNLTNLNASNLASGTVGTARLATGTANSTTYLRGDQTWATVAGGVTSLNGQTGAITNTDLYAIGSYVIGRPANSSTYAVNSTIAGSILYSVSAAIIYWPAASGFYSSWNGSTVTSATTLVNTGTWRCVSPCGVESSNGFYHTGLWVRIS
jgi:hypothetical protein